MKKIVMTVLALLTIFALAVPALAGADVRVSTKDLKVYESESTSSDVLKKIKKGKDVLIEIDDGSWCGVLVEADDGQTIGWVQSKYLRCKHDWTDWEVVREATCSKVGKKERYCRKCGEEETKEIPKKDHKFGKWVVERKATCAREGLEVRTCKVCGYEEERETIEPHTFGSWTVTREPTCTATGLREHTCMVCGFTETKTMDKLPHEFKYVITVAATDHSSGVRANVCQVCGYTEKAESYDPEGTLHRSDRGVEVQALQQLLVDQGYLNAGGADGVYGGGTERAVMQFQKDQGLTVDGVAWPQTQKRLSHDFGPWETVKPVTRTSPGERQRVCRDCGYIQRETIEAGAVIERGSRGEHVRAIQQILKEVGYSAGSCDGIYGQKLDNAYTAFESARGLIFQPGKIRPADLDALINAWFATGAGDLKESAVDSPVNLALTVTPASDESEDENATTYLWTLTNLGSNKCMFNALLLNYGSAPDFTRDNLVMVIDGAELKPNCQNSVSGRFVVASDWGEGSLNFAAMAVDEKTGGKWLSNTVTFAAEDAAEPKTVSPMAVDVNVNRLEDGIWPASFDPGDIFSGASGIYMNAVHIYTEDWYDLVDINTLKPGDSVVVEGETIEVKTVDFGDGVSVNGGLDADGVEFISEEDSNGYRVFGYDDAATYTEQGVTTLVLDANATYTDSSDLEKDPVSVSGADIVTAIAGDAENRSFTPYNTTLTVEDGKVVEINRIFVP